MTRVYYVHHPMHAGKGYQKNGLKVIWVERWMLECEWCIYFVSLLFECERLGIVAAWPKQNISWSSSANGVQLSSHFLWATPLHIIPLHTFTAASPDLLNLLMKTVRLEKACKWTLSSDLFVTLYVNVICCPSVFSKYGPFHIDIHYNYSFIPYCVICGWWFKLHDHKPGHYTTLTCNNLSLVLIYRKELNGNDVTSNCDDHFFVELETLSCWQNTIV